MDKPEAQMKGLPWTDFKDIPQMFRKLYDLILVLYPLSAAVIEQTGEYAICCEYWFNNSPSRISV
jgi:hypothetical protein